MSAAEQVQMQVIDGLASISAGIDDHAVAGGEILFTGDFGHGPQEMAEQGAVIGGCFCERNDVPARDDKQMHWRLRMDVGEGDALLVFVDACGGNASVDDLAEEAAHTWFSVTLTWRRIGVVVPTPRGRIVPRIWRESGWRGGRRSRTRGTGWDWGRRGMLRRGR